MSDCRFIIDEGGLSLDDVPQGQRKDGLTSLSDQLDALRVSGECVQILEDWGSVECLGGINVAETMVGGQVLGRDESWRLLDLLGRCEVWSPSADVDTDPQIVVDGGRRQGYGLARARDLAILKDWTAVVTTPHRFGAGVHSVDQPEQSQPVDVYFTVSTADHPGFFRLLYELEDVEEADFFEWATRAFPRLAFAENVSFRHFRGMYRVLRPQVVHHLGRINDRFPEAYVREKGMPNEVSRRLGIEVSIEGKTRGSKRLMRQREVEFRGQRHLCEWHSKIEPHQNRIHFCVLHDTAEAQILIGIFHEHLQT